MKPLLSLLLLGALAGCATADRGAASSSPTAAEATAGGMAVRSDSAPDPMTGPSLVDSYADELAETSSSFHATLAASGGEGTSCVDLGAMRDRICELARRICTIAETLPPESSAHIRCEDGEQRCERARRDLSAECP